MSNSGALLITGASRGIGAATARLAAQRGYSVCVNYRNARTQAYQVVQEIKSTGGNAIAVQADVSSDPDVLRLFKTCDEQLGPLVGLVNNAGILERQMRLDAMSADRIQRILNTNVLGTVLCAREAVRRMSTLHGGHGGSIVNVSSGAVRRGAPGQYVDYAASKGAVDIFTIGLSREVAAEGIRVNCVRPGFIYTDIHADGGEPDRVDNIKSQIPMQRGGQPEEVANTILWLLSDEASYTTGGILDVSGGNT